MRLPERLRVAGVEERLKNLGILTDTEGIAEVGVGALGVLGMSGTDELALLGWELFISSG